MCLVIDTCVLAKVFDPANQEHHLFEPVLKWITVGKGRMIYGGTKYKRELAVARKYLGIIAELERGRRAIRISKSEVDRLARAVKGQCPNRKFNDEHLVAIVIAARCRVVCTDDRDAIPYLKNTAFYRPYNLQKPKIYCYKEHKNLCHDKHVVGLCAGVIK